MNHTSVIVGALPLALLAAGCQSVLNAGFQDDGGRQTSTTTTGSRAPGSSSGTTGTNAGLGSSTAAGSSTGTGQGSSSGARTSGGSSGSSTGEYSGDAGPCQANGSACNVSVQCCSGACSGGCTQAFGAGCIEPGDCGSGNCSNGHCDCSMPQGGIFGGCATDADCCGSSHCTHFNYYSEGTYGLCCNDIGQGCSGPADCCDGNCVNGVCGCLQLGGSCGTKTWYETACCSGICGSPATTLSCLNGPGGPCSAPTDCSTNNCVDGGCGCGLFPAQCGTSTDCCGGFACGATLVIAGQFPNPGPAIDAGASCCMAAGENCKNREGYGGCCGDCNKGGICECELPGSQCHDDQGCCPGGACMTEGGGVLECCQLTGQECFSPYECCTGYCGANDTCACMPDGGQCGAIGYYTALGPAGCCSGVCGDAGQCL